MNDNKKYGICFYIIGLSGSGKSTIGKLIKRDVEKKYGKTILIHGDEIRGIYNLKGYNKDYRLNLGKSNSDLCKLITKQGINIIFTTVGLIHKLQRYNRSNIKNYKEIYIKAEIKTLLRKKKKIFYKRKTKLVWGVDLKPEFPKKPDITINNNFKKSVKNLSQELIKQL
jgi:adenylylsulfate kinase-like enzyme|tara:strand:+ start:609 stop:1115 length:507 start_codon:yes stop_codon:yes gene_type:complete